MLHTESALTCTYIHIYNITKFLDNQTKEFTKEGDNVKSSFFNTILTVGMTTPKYLMSDQVSAVELPTEEAQVPQWVYLLS
jgi:hypothetical protein